ncbi:MAG: hypothetical protein K2X43_12365 [Hyphomonadaceae bacterium]|jgi:hypothetical protein|nr:hypothetical protein [Hyphomonadaceae bacterium]
MSTIVKATAAAALLMAGATYVTAQTQHQGHDQRPSAQDGANPKPSDNKASPGPGVGSRPIGPPAGNAPADAKPGTPGDKNTTDLKKLDKPSGEGQRN